MMPVTSRQAALLVFAAAAFALLFALTMEYGYGFMPCHLCLYQRGPYAAILVLSATAAWPGSTSRQRATLLALCALAFAIDAGIALYHTGVESQWWLGPTSCTRSGPLAQTAEELMAMLNKPIVVSCDVVQWSLFGISMAGYNCLYAVGCTVLTGIAARFARKTS